MKNRLEELDGLRGIAAFIVFLSHAVGLLAVTKFVYFYKNSPAQIISDGAAAVDIFFVLSGFVLSLPFIDKNKDLNYIQFVTKRIFRLYPTYWACIILTVLLKDYYNPIAMQSLSEWAKHLWTNTIKEEDIIRHMPLIAKMDSHAINPVVWTLAVEMKMSLILPLFIFWLKKWNNPLSQVLLFLSSVSLSFLSEKFTFLPLFVIGLVLSKHWRKFEIIKQINFSKTCALFILSILLIGNRFTFSQDCSSHTQSLIASFGVAIFIPLAIWAEGLNKLLKHPSIDFLGKISYSFYLYHLPILLLTVSLLYQTYESLLIPVIASFILTILISFLSYKTTELTSMMFYRKISAWVTVRAAINRE